MNPSINLLEILASHGQWLSNNTTGNRANLRWADLNRANLNRANLRWADLSGADLSLADLSGADLGGANLNRANLSGANLRWADLSWADLNRANLRLVVANDAPQRLRAVATAALKDGALKMNAWHTCSTTHCIGGTAIHQAGEVGRLLEAAVGPQVAALMLLGVEAHSHFDDSNEEATEWLQSVLELAA